MTNSLMYSYSLCIALSLMLFLGFYFLFEITREKSIFKNYLRSRYIMGVALLLFTACSTSRQVMDSSTTGNLIIFYDSATGKEELLEAVKEYGSEVLYEYKNFNGIAVTVPPRYTMAKAIRFYKKVRGVLSVSEDRKLELY